MKMDEIDIKILTELMVDAQMPFSQIAKKIGLSHQTIGKRYERMKKEGIIKGCSVLVDGNKLGDNGTTFFMLSLAPEVKKEDVMKSLIQIPELYLIVEVIGDYDFFVWARFKNLHQLAHLIGKIRNLGNIDRIETLLLAQTYFAFSLAPKVSIKCNGIDLPR
jgi:Lrp/AsnC family transcriptional regulator for asnA, asnC and gidA